MNTRQMTLGLLIAGTLGSGLIATASPAWAAPSGPAAEQAGCRISANPPRYNKATMRLSGDGTRSGCSDKVTYFWVRVYKDIPWLPDSEKAVKGENYVQNRKLTATGACDGGGQHYTHVSTASGVSGDSVESGRARLC